MHNEDDIAIVGIGCFLPGAGNPDEFWEAILQAKSLVRELPQSRFPRKAYQESESNEDTFTNFLGGYIDEKEYERVCEERELDYRSLNRLQIMAIEASGQALKSISRSALKQRVATVLGCGWLDEQSILLQLYEEARSVSVFAAKAGAGDSIISEIDVFFEKLRKRLKPYDQNVFSSAIFKVLRKEYGLTGEAFMVDAACASSLAAIDIAMQKLRMHDADIVITGGIDAFLCPELQVVFAKTKTLANHGCLPFDKKSDGLFQGEGAAIFILQRLGDALKYRHPIWGILKSCGASSDGKAASLFEPTLAGQQHAILSALKGADEWRYDFVEGHGTGTLQGDTVELKSIDGILKSNSAKVPIGSIKALIGHTKAAAGAASVMKCVLAMRHRKVPASPYLQKIRVQTDVVFVNTELIDLSKKVGPLQFGISSFGFGGINYHLLIEEYHADYFNSSAEKRLEVFQDAIVCIGQGMVQGGALEILHAYGLKIPPKTLEQIDGLQIKAVAAAKKAMEKNADSFDLFDKKRIEVISASCLLIDSCRMAGKRIRLNECAADESLEQSGATSFVLGYKDRFPKITEDSGPGTLNNVIAGRVSNYFDFRGKSFNIDADFMSKAAAIKQACLELTARSADVVFVISSHDEKLAENGMHIERGEVQCLILSLESTALKKGCVIESIVHVPRYSEV